MRWMRNQFAHEVDIRDSDLCTEDDLEWIHEFCDRMMEGDDPFSILHREKEEERQRIAQLAKSEREEATTNTVKLPPKKSFGERFVDWLKSLFR